MSRSASGAGPVPDMDQSPDQQENLPANFAGTEEGKKESMHKDRPWAGQSKAIRELSSNTAMWGIWEILHCLTIRN